MSPKRLLVSFAAGALALAIAAPSFAQEQKPADSSHAAQPKSDHKEHKKDHKAEHKKEAVGELKPGDQAPEFKLKDTSGKEVDLAALTKEGKIVVLQWFNPRCPYVQKHYNGPDKTFNALNEKYKDKGVVLLAINSGPQNKPGSGAAESAEAAKKWDIKYPILIDETQSVGLAYGAKNTPNMVVIGKDGKVAYMGAIDDDRTPEKPGKTNYVAKALDQLLAGTTVTTAKTQPYGCHIAYKENN